MMIFVRTALYSQHRSGARLVTASCRLTSSFAAMPSQQIFLIRCMMLPCRSSTSGTLRPRREQLEHTTGPSCRQEAQQPRYLLISQCRMPQSGLPKNLRKSCLGGSYEASILGSAQIAGRGLLLQATNSNSCPALARTWPLTSQRLGRSTSRRRAERTPAQRSRNRSLPQRRMRGRSVRRRPRS